MLEAKIEQENTLMEKRRINPNIGEAKTGDLKGLYSLDIYHN